MAEDLDPVLPLVEQIQSGVDQEENFSKIFLLYHQRVVLFFRRKGFPPDESWDLAQETFLHAFHALPSFRHRSSFLVWLFGIMENVFRNNVRRRMAGKRDGLEVSIDAQRPEGGPLLELEAGGEDLLSGLISREQSKALRAALRAALEKLPEQMRLCCILRYEKGYKYQEIARLMGVSIETVKSHLHQARKRLSIELGETELL
jgi:RNA polymerase sigma-70 factor (ECF subfamily)